jgi:5-methylcytosine-specific restriction endonuclease McrA
MANTFIGKPCSKGHGAETGENEWYVRKDGYGKCVLCASRSSKRFYKKNTDKCKQWTYNYRANNADKMKQFAHSRQGREQHNTDIKSTDIERIVLDFGRKCAYCRSGAYEHIDHAVPLSCGGEHVLGNLLPSCSNCNMRKNARDPWEWFRCQSFYTKARENYIKRSLQRQATRY